MSNPRYLTAQQAADMLGINLGTLYSYVSRGLIRSEDTGDDKRTHRYYAEDVQRLSKRKAGRRNPESAAASGLHYGLPVLESKITLIDNGRLYYRGHDVLRLAGEARIEQVALLLWTGEGSTARQVFDHEQVQLSGRLKMIQALMSDANPVERFGVLLPLAGADDLAAYDLRPEALVQTGARIVRLLVNTAAKDDSGKQRLLETLTAAWGGGGAEAGRLLNAALILCADHELNVSSFTARVVASGGATLYHVVSAGLAALQGVKHGGHVERVAALLREAGSPDGVRGVLAERLKRGEALPGFGHPLYPDGDPRGRLLLELAAAAYPDAPTVKTAQALAQQVGMLPGKQPTIDLGLAVLSSALNLPPGGALALFAIGRSIGWIGHALEQYAQEKMIRPRARYTGMLPGESADRRKPK